MQLIGTLAMLDLFLINNELSTNPKARYKYI